MSCKTWIYPTVSFMCPSDFPKGDPFNIGQMYTLFAEAVRTGTKPPADIR